MMARFNDQMKNKQKIYFTRILKKKDINKNKISAPYSER